MKKKSIGWFNKTYANLFAFLFITLIILGAASCASQPTVEDPPADPPAQAIEAGPSVSQADIDALNAASARALSARDIVLSFNGDEEFPSEWQSASTLLSNAENQRNVSTPENTRESTARFIRAAEAMEELADLTLERNREAALQELMRARNAAINAGAMTYTPDYLNQADAALDEADALYQAGNYHAARDRAMEALAMYEIIGLGLEANVLREEIAARADELVPDFLYWADETAFLVFQYWDDGDFLTAREYAIRAYSMYDALNAGIHAYIVREEIEAHGFERFDRENVDLADDALYNAMDNYVDGNYVYARTRIDDASRRYNQALRTGWRLYATERSDAVVAQRQIAIENRANVAVRDEFNTAQQIFVRGSSIMGEARYQEAVVLFNESESIFHEVSIIALERRQLAEEALIRANQRMAESDETARNAETILRGGAAP